LRKQGLDYIKFSTSVIAICGVVIANAATAYAQETEDGSDQEERSSSSIDALTNDTIVVTGTKKSGGQNVQEATVSVVAFGEAQLEALNVQDISGLSFKVPNVALDEIGTVKGVANFTIRGLGTNSSIPSIDPAVGTFVDGVYLGLNFGVVYDTFDLSGIETLRGPQGVLFGRNVTGGAVLINTGDPTDDLSVKGKVNVESGLRGTGTNFLAQASISGPIIRDVLTAKAAIYYNDDGGWFANFVPNDPNATGIDATDPNVDLNSLGTFENFGLSETLIIRGALKFTPTDDITLTVKYEHGDQEGQGPAAQTHVNGSGVAGQIVNFGRDSFGFSVDERGENDATWDFITAKAEIQVGSGTITNIFGYRRFNQFSRLDVDSTPQFLFHADFITDQDQISNEIRYNGLFFDDRLDFTAGGFYFEQDLIYQENRDLGLGGFVTQNGGGLQDQRTIGIFASADFKVTDALTFTAGLRWSDEEKDAVITNLALNTNNPCIIDASVRPRLLPDGTDTSALCVADFEDSFSTSNFSPKVGLSYLASDTLRFYGHWARSFRAGGFNLRNTSGAAGTQDSFEDERIDSFEIGFKSEPFQGARVNGAIFYNILNDLQRETNVSDPSAGVVQVIANTADARIFGFEADASIPVSNNVVLTMGIGYLDFQYNDVFFDLNGDGTIDQGDLDLQIPRLAPLSANVGFLVSQELRGLGFATLNVNYTHRDAAFFTDNNLGVLNASDRVDVNLSLEILEGKANVSVYANNLTNDVQIGGDTQLPTTLVGSPLGGTFSPLARGRIFGVELQVGF